MNHQISITPNRVLHGEKVSIILNGFLPHQELSIKAFFTDKENKTWSSIATFKANEEGIVDVQKDAPLSGSYQGVEPMGLFVYMEEENTKEKVAFWEKGLHETVVKFSVLADGKEVATNTLARYILEPTIRQETLPNGLQGTLFLPHDKPNKKVLICLSGSDGGIPNELAATFASHGLASVSLGYFSHEGLPKNLSQIPMEYFKKALDFLGTHPETKGAEIAVVGGSRGGELALLLASRYAQISSVVAYAPSHVMWSGYGDYKEMKRSSWSYKGKELPFVQVKMSLGAMFRYFFSKKPIEFTSTFLNSLKKEVKEEAIIAVENIKGEVLLISGEDDQMWCSTLMANRVMSRLKKHNFAYGYEHLTYPNAGHFITIPYYPSTHKNVVHPHDKKVYALGGSTVGDLRASEDSWVRVLAFLKR